jgi:UDP-N-acetylmuramate dehydrogenase
MKILKNIPLKSYNTFGLEYKSKYFIEIKKEEDLISLVNEDLFKTEKKLILGGGSNILLTKNFDGLIIKNSIKGQEIVNQNQKFVDYKIGAGENWHEIVLKCVDNNWGGIENLSLIPGNTGTAPMQNIGAYGMEIKETFICLEALELSSGKIVKFNNADCKFGYRESVFKNEKKNQYVILNITLRLNKNPKVNITYGDIKNILNQENIQSPTIRDVSNAIIKIRQSKLPDPKKIGNSGRFFKNPIISNDLFLKVQQKYPDIAHYKVNNKQTKIAAGWLIENAGWKGKRINNFGVHKKQALVLVNYGGASGDEIFDFSESIIKDIKVKYGIQLEREVNII